MRVNAATQQWMGWTIAAGPARTTASRAVCLTRPGSHSPRESADESLAAWIERHAICLAGGWPACPVQSPAAHDPIGVPRIEFNQPRHRPDFSAAISVVRSRQRGRDHAAGSARIANRAPTNPTGFRRAGRSGGFLMFQTSPWSRSPHCQWRCAPSGHPAEDRLVLALVVGTAQREGVLGPDDERRITCRRPHGRQTATHPVRWMTFATEIPPPAMATVGASAASRKSARSRRLSCRSRIAPFRRILSWQLLA